MTHVELLLQGDFLGLIRAEVFVVAGLRLEWLGADFYVRVTVDLSGINEVRKYVTRLVRILTLEERLFQDTAPLK